MGGNVSGVDEVARVSQLSGPYGRIPPDMMQAIMQYMVGSEDVQKTRNAINGVFLQIESLRMLRFVNAHWHRLVDKYFRNVISTYSVEHGVILQRLTVGTWQHRNKLVIVPGKTPKEKHRFLVKLSSFTLSDPFTFVPVSHRVSNAHVRTDITYVFGTVIVNFKYKMIAKGDALIANRSPIGSVSAKVYFPRGEPKYNHQASIAIRFQSDIESAYVKKSEESKYQLLNLPTVEWWRERGKANSPEIPPSDFKPWQQKIVEVISRDIKWILMGANFNG